MPRPRKFRQVCCMPSCALFGPVDGRAAEIVTMTVEEYETIRLIDLEDCSQEQCALRMGIARTTVQGIYDAARSKLAEALVYGRLLRIEGGDYKLCEADEGMASCHCGSARESCPRRRRREQGCAAMAGRPAAEHTETRMRTNE